MKTIFERANYEELQSRVKKLSASSKPLWGKMNVGQMLHHLNMAMEAPLGKVAVKGKPVFFMKIFKSVLYNDKPFGKGAPTPGDFKITGSYYFDDEKEKCLNNLNQIFTNNIMGTYLPHVFFGAMTNEQWGMHFYKHADHHLKQFGV